MRTLSISLFVLGVLVILFRNFEDSKLLFIAKNVLMGVNVTFILVVCFLLSTMIVYYRSDEGAFRRPHSLLANRTDNTMLYNGIKIGIHSTYSKFIEFLYISLIFRYND